MKKLIYILALISFMSLSSYSQKVLEINADKIMNFKSSMDLRYLNDEKKPSIQTVKSNEEVRVFTLNYKSFESIVHSDYTGFIISDFPVTTLSNDIVDLKRTNSVIDANTKFKRGTSNGIIEVKAPEIHTFIGKIRNQENSKVFLTYCDGDMFGYVENNEGFKYSISSTSTIDSKYDKPHLMTSHESLVPAFSEENPFNCMTVDYAGDKKEIHDHDIKENNEIQAVPKLLEVPLYLEGTYDYYALLGSNYSKAAVYMIAVIAHTSKIYEEYLNCTFSILEILIWDNKNNDPYNGTKNLSEKLQAMPDNWSGDPSKRALVSLFANLSNQPPNTVIAGISMGGDPEVGSLCNKQRGYNVFGIKGNGKYPTMNYTWDVQCAGHEIGHNFSAPHTHNCYFGPSMIDTCVTQDDNRAQAPDACLKLPQKPISRLGTLMSYCHLGNTTESVAFIIHPRQVKMMRKAVEASACVAEPTSPKVRLLTFLGDKTYLTGTSEKIRFTSSKVSNVKIQWSKDNGATWEVLAPSVSATDTIFNWTIPTVATTKALMMVLDASNPGVSDTSKTVFTISSASLVLTKPGVGEKYAVKEDVYINWTATLIDAFNIYSSNDAGKTWTTLASNIKSNSYTWTNHLTPGKYIVKVANAVDPNYFVLTPEIELGLPTLTLIKPNGGENFCWNQPNDITWNYNFINTVYLQYSLDNGTTWKNVIIGSVDTKSQKYSWKPANQINSTQALIKISAGYDKTEVLATSKAVFKIDSCIVGVEDFEYISGLEITELVPNPVINNATLRIANNNNINLTAKVEIINEIGAIVKDLNSLFLPSNSKNEIKFNVDEFSNGNYFIIVKTEKGNLNYPLRIFR
jgi:hypothetical protein